MAGGAARLRIDVELLFEFEAQIFGRFHAEVRVSGDVMLRIILKIIDFLQRAEVLFRSLVAIKAPRHRLALCLIDDFHLIDVAVAALAGNSAIHVSGMVEINVIRRLVNPDPLDRLAVVAGIADIHRLMKRRELRAVFLNVLVAVPAGISRRYVRMAGNIDERVTIPTVETELIDVDFVRKWDRLGRLIADHLRLWRRIIGEGQGDAADSRAGANGDLQR